MNCSEQPGNHYCWLFACEQSHRELLTAFLLEGLEKGEKIIYITDINSTVKITDYLRKIRQDSKKILASEQLEILSSHATYLKQGYFNPDRMIDLLHNGIDRSVTEGFTGLRVSSEMTWILRDVEGIEQLLAYEVLINDCFNNDRNFLTLCQYDLRFISPGVVAYIITVHPVIINGTITYHNCYYVPGEPSFIGSVDITLDQMLARLKRADGK